MSTPDEDRVEASLRQRAEELRRTRKALRREGEGMLESELTHVDQHPADDATETHEREVAQTTEVFLDEEQHRIEEARRALEHGTYGTCADCGRGIEPARLEAVPEAVRCIDCQRTFEGLHRQANDGVT